MTASRPKVTFVGEPATSPPELTRLRSPLNANLALASGAICYAALLHVAFQHIIAPTKEYRGGFVYRTPEMLPYVVSIAIVVLLACLLPKNIYHLSHFVLWVLFMGAVAPVILAGNYIDVVPIGDAFFLGLNLAACLILVRLATELRPTLHLSGTLRDLARFFPVGCLAVTAAVISYLAFRGLLSFEFLSLSDVYEVRSEFRRVGEGDFISGYIVPAQFYVIGPTVIAFGLLYRKVGWTLIGVMSQLILYATVGHKTVLFSILAVFGVFALFRNGRRGATKLFLVVTGVGSAMVLLDLATGGRLFTEVVVRRFLLTPAVLAQDYLKVFGDGPRTNFAEVVPLGENPYGKAPSLVVGDLIFGGGVNADASLWMHGYASYGYIGMYGVTALLVGVLWVMDDVTSKVPLPLVCSVFVMPAVAIGEASIFTAMLSHGLLVAIACAFLLPVSRASQEEPFIARTTKAFE